MVLNGHNLVTCDECLDKHCNYCDIDELSGRQTCASCDVGYGINPDNQKCEPCLSMEGCNYCMENNKICQTCKQGYYKDHSTSKCLRNPDPECNSYDAFNKRCNWCK